MRRVVRAPGRVNIIGEHTDYSGGLVMPMAIQLDTSVALSPRPDRWLVVSSDALGETTMLDLDALRPARHWSDYVAGVAAILQDEGHNLGGADLRIASTLPRGAGLSSSAALEVASGYALLAQAGAPIDRLALALACQRAENEFVGARVGIMDQYAACLGERCHALVIDCHSLEHRALPMPADIAVVVCNTMVRHSIATSQYNARREQIESATAYLAREQPHVKTLRDVSMEDLEQHRESLGSVAYKRARHIVSENARVAQAADALERGDLTRLGNLMANSHRSLRDDYDVSCDELDLMVDLASSEPGVIGTRMTGGGFGGCTVSLVHTSSADRVLASLQRRYAEITGMHPDGWICAAAGGVEELKDAR